MHEHSGFIRATLFLAFVITFSTCGYLVIESGWSVSDAFYMTVITLSTVGFQEANNLSESGRFFTIIVIALGLGSVALFGKEMGQIIIERGIRSTIGGTKMKEKINRLKEHYIICGYGRLGSAVAASLKEQGLDIVVIEKDESLFLKAKDDGFLVIQGNATSDPVLKAAGIERAIGIVAGLGSDSDNLFISLAARELNQKVMIISRNEERDVEQRILRAGADVVISPLSLSGKHIAKMISQNNRTPVPEKLNDKLPSILGFSLRMFRHPEHATITVADALRLSGALQAVGIRRSNGETELNPGEDAVINQNDSAILLVKE